MFRIKFTLKNIPLLPYIFGILFSFFLITNLNAAPLSVQVVEKGEGSVIAGATVVIGETDNYKISNKDGMAFFENLVLPTNVKVLANGFETTTVYVINAEKIIVVYLPPQTLDGDNLTVTADRIEEKASKITLTAAELAHAPGSQGDPLVAIQSLPGIIVTNDGSGQAYMRGSDKTQNAAVIDRVPIGYLFHFGWNRSTIHPKLVSDLNIFLSGYPVEYPDVLGGVIDVRLREPKKDRVHYNFDVSLIESSFLIEGPVNKTDSYYFAARRSYIDLIFSPEKFNDAFGSDETDNPDRIIQVPRYYDAQAAYRREIDGGYLNYFFYGAGDALTFEINEGLESDPQLAGETSVNADFQTYGVTYHQNINPNWSLDIPMFYRQNRTEFKIGTDEFGNPFIAESTLNQYSVLPMVKWRLNTANTLSFGMDASYFDAPINLYISAPPDDPNFNLSNQAKRRFNGTIYGGNISNYVKLRSRLTKSLTTLIGARYSKIEFSGDIDLERAVPRAGIEYQINPKMLFVAGVGEYIQFPQGFEIIEDFGNPNLSFTQAQHQTLGLHYDLNNLWSAKVEVYQKHFTRLVTSFDDPDPQNPLPAEEKYINEGTGEAYGAEIYIKRERRNGKMGWMSYSYSKSKRHNGVDSNFLSPGDIPHSIKLVWSQDFHDGPFDWMKDWKRWTWGIKVDVHSGNPYTRVIDTEYIDSADHSKGFFAVTGPKNAERTPTFFQADLRIERHILNNKSKAKLYVEILNFTNHKNIVNYDYGRNYEKIDNPTPVTGFPLFPYFGFETSF